MSDMQTDPLAQKIRDRFDRSVEELDAATLSGITRARYRALEQKRERRAGPMLWLPAGALATVSLAVILFGLQSRQPVEEKGFIDEMEIVSELDLYEDLEFYDWLDQNEIST